MSHERGCSFTGGLRCGSWEWDGKRNSLVSPANTTQHAYKQERDGSNCLGVQLSQFGKKEEEGKI